MEPISKVYHAFTSDFLRIFPRLERNNSENISIFGVEYLKREHLFFGLLINPFLAEISTNLNFADAKALFDLVKKFRGLNEEFDNAAYVTFCESMVPNQTQRPILDLMDTKLAKNLRACL